MFLMVILQLWNLIWNKILQLAWKQSQGDEKQPVRGVLRKRCSENMQQIYSRTPMPKCDFNKVFTLPWVFSCKYTAFFQRIANLSICHTGERSAVFAIWCGNKLCNLVCNWSTKYKLSKRPIWSIVFTISEEIAILMICGTKEASNRRSTICNIFH